MSRPTRPTRPALRGVLRGAVALGTGLAVAAVPFAVTGTATATTPTTPTTPAVTTGCASGKLPMVVRGRSADLKKGLPAGAWVWHDRNGFHLRVTHDAKTKLVFTGAVVSSGRISANRIRDERGDVLWRNSTRNAVRFVLRNHGGIDGIDFRVGCAKKVTIVVSAAKVKLATNQIHLGRTSASPTSNGFAIQRS